MKFDSGQNLLFLADASNMPKQVRRIDKLNSVGAKGILSFGVNNPGIVIKNVRKLWHFYLKTILPAKVIGGHQDYTRFIILGRARSGSNLVRGSLMAHHQISVFGDIFRKDKVIHWGIPYYPQTSRQLSLFQTDSARFVQQEVFGKFPRGIKAVGFKSLYPQQKRQVWNPVEAYLTAEKTIKIIHIKRRNILKAHLSLIKVDNHRDKWTNISGSPQETDQTYRLDYQTCLQAFEDTRRWEAEQDALFSNHPKLDMYYEDITANYDEQMRRVQEFLGVAYRQVRPLTYKQSQQSLSTSIANYQELKAKFVGTPWIEFFID